jgi:hypothetical protein
MSSPADTAPALHGPSRRRLARSGGPLTPLAACIPGVRLGLGCDTPFRPAADARTAAVGVRSAIGFRDAGRIGELPAMARKLLGVAAVACQIAALRDRGG